MGNLSSENVSSFVLQPHESQVSLFFQLDKKGWHLHTGWEKGSLQRTNGYSLWTMGGGEMMNVFWIVNTNTFLLILLIIMVSYLTTQVNGLIRWLKRE
jgi:hypothetical protein